LILSAVATPPARARASTISTIAMVPLWRRACVSGGKIEATRSERASASAREP
jgi:hypothetical protein